jgi:glutamate 5-kinase
MLDPVRQEIAVTADPLVVKVGTRVLTRFDGTLDEDQIAAFAVQLAALASEGRRVALVSSGAVGAGMGRLKMSARPSDLAELQAVAALGQSRLIEAYNRALETHGRHAAQILLTSDDMNDRGRYLNVRNTILALFRFGAIPIINENDTVRVDELKLSVGDNDRLAAMVTNLIRAPLLVLLSDVAGLYDGDPKNPLSSVIPTVRDVDAAIKSLVHDTSPKFNQLSRGGMQSKLEAARLATSAGENVIIADGRRPDVLGDILSGKQVGTLFLAAGPAVTSRKRWIGLTADPRGRIVLDAGAEQAVVQGGRSLLAVGITGVEGRFEKGDVVALCNAAGKELARGLTNYSFHELRQIAGRSTERFAEILGHRPYDEVVHRDNLALV